MLNCQGYFSYESNYLNKKICSLIRSRYFSNSFKNNSYVTCNRDSESCSLPATWRSLTLIIYMLCTLAPALTLDHSLLHG